MGNNTRRTRLFRKGGKPCGCQGRGRDQRDRGRPRYHSFASRTRDIQTEKFCRSTLRCVTSVVINCQWGAITEADFTYEWRPRRPWLMVCRGDIDRLRTELRRFINRRNHEAKEMNRTYGFESESEAKHKHGDQTYKIWDTRWCCKNMVLNPIPLASLPMCTSIAPHHLFARGHRRS